MNVLFYLAATVAILWLMAQLFRNPKRVGPERVKGKARAQSREVWVQIYDTDSLEEARSIQAHLEEEEIHCLVYEQGRRDVHGNPLKGYGISVPRYFVTRAQKIVSRMAV